MDELSVEIAAIKAALAVASEKIDTLKDIAAVSDNMTSSETASLSDELGQQGLVGRAETMLRWSRFKTKTLDLGTGLFSDSCWDMCLDIYICDLKREQITVSSIAHSSGIPMTTAMRYINVMVEEGLLEKSPNPSDNRMIFISTSEICRDKISNVLHNLA
jgi:hypothetical protein